MYWAIWTISKPLNLTEAVRGTFWFVRTWDYQFNMQSFITKNRGLCSSQMHQKARLRTTSWDLILGTYKMLIQAASSLQNVKHVRSLQKFCRILSSWHKTILENVKKNLVNIKIFSLLTSTLYGQHILGLKTIKTRTYRSRYLAERAHACVKHTHYS